MGTLITSERSYELFPIPEMLKKSRQSELEKVIVLWRNNNFNVSEIATSNYRRQTEFDQFTFGNDGMEIPLDEDGNITNAGLKKTLMLLHLLTKIYILYYFYMQFHYMKLWMQSMTLGDITLCRLLCSTSILCIFCVSNCTKYLVFIA